VTRTGEEIGGAGNRVIVRDQVIAVIGNLDFEILKRYCNDQNHQLFL
jgi:hypothetical protein